MPSIAHCPLPSAFSAHSLHSQIQLSQRYICGSKITMTTTLLRRKAGPWKRDIEKKNRTVSVNSKKIIKSFPVK